MTGPATERAILTMVMRCADCGHLVTPDPTQAALMCACPRPRGIELGWSSARGEFAVMIEPAGWYEPVWRTFELAGAYGGLQHRICGQLVGIHAIRGQRSRPSLLDAIAGAEQHVCDIRPPGAQT